MSDLKVSPLIKTLSENYVNNRISFEEYRLERKTILRQIDSEFNQRTFEDAESISEALDALETLEDNKVDIIQEEVVEDGVNIDIDEEEQVI